VQREALKGGLSPVTQRLVSHALPAQVSLTAAAALCPDARGDLAVFGDHHAVDDDEVEALRVLVRLLYVALILHARRIEDHDVRRHAFANLAAVEEAERARRQRRHAAHRFLKP